MSWQSGKLIETFPRVKPWVWCLNNTQWSSTVIHRSFIILGYYHKIFFGISDFVDSVYMHTLKGRKLIWSAVKATNMNWILVLFCIYMSHGFLKRSFNVKSTLHPILTKLKKQTIKQIFKNLLIPKLNLYTLVQKICNPISIPEFCVWFFANFFYTSWENEKDDKNRWMAFLM